MFETSDGLVKKTFVSPHYYGAVKLNCPRKSFATFAAVKNLDQTVEQDGRTRNIHGSIVVFTQKAAAHSKFAIGLHEFCSLFQVLSKLGILCLSPAYKYLI